MCGSVEYGVCKVCGQEGPLVRTYFYYDVKCECHSDKHFEFVSHCSTCTPIEPSVTKLELLGLKPIWWKTKDLKIFLTYAKEQKEKFMSAFGL